MQITHDRARQLIQLNLDKALNLQEKAVLSAHLQACTECWAYASEMKGMESVLVPAMKRQWDIQPTPLSIPALTQMKNSMPQSLNLLATRTAVISVVFATLLFSAWQLLRSEIPLSNQLAVGALPVPTPSAQSTSTKITYEDCEFVLYPVQRNDTLAGIARRFSISEEELMTINNLQTETVLTTPELTIPVCNLTPTGTVNSTTLTTTYTPVIRPVTSTPGG
jgi:LysM repeat protein